MTTNDTPTMQTNATAPVAQELALAALIRDVDGTHTLGASALAEALIARGVTVDSTTAAAPGIAATERTPVALTTTLAAHAVQVVDFDNRAICRCGGNFHDDTSGVEPDPDDVTHAQHLAEKVLSDAGVGMLIADLARLAFRWQNATAIGTLSGESQPDLVTRGFGDQLAGILNAHDITVLHAKDEE